MQISPIVAINEKMYMIFGGIKPSWLNILRYLSYKNKIGEKITIFKV